MVIYRATNLARGLQPDKQFSLFSSLTEAETLRMNATGILAWNCECRLVCWGRFNLGTPTRLSRQMTKTNFISSRKYDTSITALGWRLMLLLPISSGDVLTRSRDHVYTSLPHHCFRASPFYGTRIPAPMRFTRLRGSKCCGNKRNCT